MKRKHAPSSHADLPFTKPQRAARLVKEAQEREERILRLGEIVHDCLERSHRRCENPGCGKVLTTRGYHLDHWLGGNGRRREQESKETTWILCMECDYARTHNAPSAGYWNARFKSHCERHGYPFTPHITRIEQLAELAKESA